MKQLAKGMLVAVAAAGLGACGEPVAPANPTWERDIRPLMVARCIRCHTSPGNQDPQVTTGIAAGRRTMFNFSYERFQDFDALSLAGVTMSARYVRGEVPMWVMPPPPAEKLESWEIDMLANWAKNPQ